MSVALHSTQYAPITWIFTLIFLILSIYFYFFCLCMCAMLVFFGRMIRVRVLPFLTHCCVARSTLKLLNGESQSWKGSRHYHSSLSVTTRVWWRRRWWWGFFFTQGRRSEVHNWSSRSSRASRRLCRGKSKTIYQPLGRRTHTQKHIKAQAHLRHLSSFISSAAWPESRCDTNSWETSGWMGFVSPPDCGAASRNKKLRHTHTHTTLGFQNRILTVTEGRFIDGDLCSPILTCS